MKKGHDKNYALRRAGFAHIEIFFVILAIAVLGISVFFVQKNSGSSMPKVTSTPEEMMEDETSDWETYTGKHFMFKYPRNMEVRSSGEDNAHGYINNERLFEFSYQTYEDSVETNIGNDVKTETVGGKTAEVYEGENGLSEGDTTPTVQYDIRDRNILTQLFFYGSVPISELQSQILSTFEFTKNALSNQPENSTEKYTNTEFGFQFSYPSQMVIIQKETYDSPPDTEVFYAIFPETDQVPLYLYVFQTSDSLTNWWSINGLKTYNQDFVLKLGHESISQNEVKTENKVIDEIPSLVYTFDLSDRKSPIFPRKDQLIVMKNKNSVFMLILPIKGMYNDMFLDSFKFIQ